MFGKRKFYSLKEILKKGATYNIIMGDPERFEQDRQAMAEDTK